MLALTATTNVFFEGELSTPPKYSYNRLAPKQKHLTVAGAGFGVAGFAGAGTTGSGLAGAGDGMG